MANSSDSTPEELAARVGRLIRSLRATHGLTVAELADRSELSRTILTRIERGDGNPSISTLWQLSRGLGVPLGELLVEPAPPRVRLTRAGEGAAMDDPSGMSGRLLHTEGRARRSDLFAIELAPGARRSSPPHLTGVEELVVLTAGRAEVGPDGATETLGTGDSLWFVSDVEHRYATVGRAACGLLCFMFYPPAMP